MNVKIKGNGGLLKFLGQRKTKRMLFFAALVAFPIIQFSICYVYVNFNSFLLAFQKYELARTGINGYVITFAKFDNFKEAWSLISQRMFMFENSLQLFFWTTGVGFTLALMFSYYIYKRYPLAGLFRVILFIPKIMSGVVFSLLFKYIANDVYVHVMETVFNKQNVLGILDSPETRLAGMLFFSVWVGFGVNVLMFTGTMSGIDESIVESAQLDGANTVQEFIYITFPLIWPTFVSFLTVNLAGIFTDQMHLHTMFGVQALSGDLATFGYYLYVTSSQSELVQAGATPPFSVLSAMGLIMTAVLMPTILTIRKLLRKYGPSTK